MIEQSRPYFRYDNPADQGRVYDATGLGSWWRSVRTDAGWHEVLIGREKPRDAE
jgi:hypothetical protein